MSGRARRQPDRQEESIRDTVRQVLLPIPGTRTTSHAVRGCLQQGWREAKRIDLYSPEAVAALVRMDRYLLAHTRALVEDVRGALDAYDVAGACEASSPLPGCRRTGTCVLGVSASGTRTAPRSTRYAQLVTLMELAPPAAVAGRGDLAWPDRAECVHLTDYPVIDGPVDAPGWSLWMSSFDRVVGSRAAPCINCACASRWPLPAGVSVRCSLEPFADLIASEVNVKSVVFSAPENSGLSVRTELSLNRAAPSVRKLTGQLFKAQSRQWADGRRRDAVSRASWLTALRWKLTQATCSRCPPPWTLPSRAPDVLASGTFVVLDGADPELEAEGYARDVVRCPGTAVRTPAAHRGPYLTWRFRPITWLTWRPVT